MKHLFVPYELSKELKELGFDEPCIGFYKEDDTRLRAVDQHWGNSITGVCKNLGYEISDIILAPMFSQVIKWFREKYQLHGMVDIIYVNPSHWYYRIERLQTKDDYLYHSEDDQLEFETYEEAEYNCLKKLIDFAKNENRT